MYEARVVLHERGSLEHRFAWPDWRQSIERLSVDAILSQVQDVDPQTCRRLMLSGCPLEHPALFDVIAAFRAKEFRHLAVESDAVGLATAGTVARLRDLGVESFFLFVGGIRERVYAHVMQDPSSFRTAMAGVHEALVGAPQVYVVVPLVKWNLQDLDPLLDWLLALGGKLQGFLLALPEIARVPHSARSLVLSYAQAAAVAERIFSACQSRGVQYGFFSKRAACLALRAGTSSASRRCFGSGCSTCATRETTKSWCACPPASRVP